jgi:hypothetical protein
MLNLKYQVIYREHNKMNLETVYIGPFNTYEEAYDELCKMPALGTQSIDDDVTTPNPGVKFIEPLWPTYELAIQFRTHCMNYDGDLEDAVRSFEI